MTTCDEKRALVLCLHQPAPFFWEKKSNMRPELILEAIISFAIRNEAMWRECRSVPAHSWGFRPFLSLFKFSLFLFFFLAGYSNAARRNLSPEVLARGTANVKRDLLHRHVLSKKKSYLLTQPRNNGNETMSFFCEHVFFSSVG